MKRFNTIGVLTSGGDAPGMNCAIRAITRRALANGLKVKGIIGGYSGLIKGEIIDLDARAVSNIENLGGTVLLTDRCDEFKTEEGMQKAIEVCRANEIDGIVAIGGDGTFRGATDLSLRGIACIGLPGTIDNDITSTDYTIGFDTAMNTVIEMVDRLRDTCESHARCNVVEVMGREAGWIALESGIAVGASAIAIKELPFDEEAAIQDIIEAKAAGKRNFIVVVSEGMGADFGESFTKRIEEKTGIETRFARLAHVVRGGSPTLRDRLLGSTMGVAAVEALLEGKSDIVICERGGKVCHMEISEALTLDRMFKGKMKPEELDKYSPETVAEMKNLCERNKQKMRRLYDVAMQISK